MKFKKYGTPWYFTIKGALFLLISAISLTPIQGIFSALGFFSSVIIVIMAFAVFGTTYVSKSSNEKILIRILALCHLAFAVIIFVLTIKGNLEYKPDHMRAIVILFWIRNWFAFFFVTELIEAIHLWINKNAHCITIFIDSTMTAIFLVVFSFLNTIATEMVKETTHLTIDDLKAIFPFFALITLLAGVGTIASAFMLSIFNKDSQ